MNFLIERFQSWDEDLIVDVPSSLWMRNLTDRQMILIIVAMPYPLFLHLYVTHISDRIIYINSDPLPSIDQEITLFGSARCGVCVKFDLIGGQVAAKSTCVG